MNSLLSTFGQRILSYYLFAASNCSKLHIGVSETLIFALNKFSLKARHVPQIKMTVTYGIFLILQIYCLVNARKRSPNKLHKTKTVGHKRA